MILKKIFPISFRNLPITILLIGIFFAVINLLMSYIATAYTNDVPYLDFKSVVSLYQPLNLILLSISFLVGIGILGVKRWAFFLYLLYNIALMVHGIYYLVKYWGFNSELLSTESLVGNMTLVITSFALTLYILNAEISTPYLTLVPRGFRKKWRIDIPIKGFLTDAIGNKMEIQTLDISPSGCLAKVNGYMIQEGSYDLTLDIENQWSIPAKVVRFQEEDVGLKFIYTSKLDPRRKELKKYLESKLMPRYSTSIQGKFSFNTSTFNSEILNISEGGFYITTNQTIPIDSDLNFEFKLIGFTFKGIGKVSWVNPTSKYNKPSGIGVSFQKINNEFFFQTLIQLQRIFTHFENRDR
jgi:Tfp pilus assembly protein PilZ